METIISNVTPTGYPLHGIEDGPEESRPILEAVQQNYGFLPNLIQVFAASPSAAAAYIDLGQKFSETSLSSIEQNVLLIAVSETNSCDYCLAAHTAVATGAMVPPEYISALREGRPIEDAKLQAFRVFVQEVVETRGRPREETQSAFFEAGYSKKNVIEVMLGVTMKTLSNYVNHFADTPIDEPFQPFARTA